MMWMTLRVLLALCCSVALLGCAQAQRAKTAAQDTAPVAPYAQRADVRAFAIDVAERRQLDAGWVEAQLALARRQEASQRLMMPAPAGSKRVGELCDGPPRPGSPTRNGRLSTSTAPIRAPIAMHWPPQQARNGV